MKTDEEYPVLKIPPQLMTTLYRYKNYHQPTGDFLKAVISNDLTLAFMRADLASERAMKDIVSWCYYELPGPSRGSLEAYDNWTKSYRPQMTMAEQM